jgi:glucose-1-phosphate cytidylyltransferase
LNCYLDYAATQDKVASFLAVQPSQSFHVIKVQEDGLVESIEPVIRANLWINGGYFVFKKDIFDYIREGEELVNEPFHRLIEQRQLAAYRHDSFWACMDTLKEKTMFDEMYARGKTPWTVWETPAGNGNPRETRSPEPSNGKNIININQFWFRRSVG